MVITLPLDIEGDVSSNLDCPSRAFHSLITERVIQLDP